MTAGDRGSAGIVFNQKNPPDESALNKMFP
jgi:hypothetical protein